MDAVVYTSQTGFTAEYARMLGERTGLKVYSLKEARKHLSRKAEVVYMGWIMASSIRGCAEATKHFQVRAVCGVGMSESGSQVEEIRKANKLPAALPVFTLQGGFDMNRLRGASRLMMKLVKPALEKQMAAKPDRTLGEEAALNLLRNGGSCVQEWHLAPLVEWLRTEKEK